MSREFNITVTRLTRSPARVWPISDMQTIEIEDRLGDDITRMFGILKQRLLLRRLDETPELETHALIMRQADEASFLACLTSYPLLTFPCLFDERATAATEQARRQAHRYWTGLEMVSRACAA